MKSLIQSKKALFIIAIIMLAAIYVLSIRNTAGDKSGQHKLKPVPTKAVELPSSYERPAGEPGHVEEISYKTTLIDGSGKVVDKNAMVYLPYGYDKSRKYDIFYLNHGYGASNTTFLGTPNSPHSFKHILDNMIQNGDIKPIIVVTPTYTFEYGRNVENIQTAMGMEITNDLMPAVEGKYSTYAAEPTAAEFRKSRNHRGIGGFSLGGSTAWWAFHNHIDIFKYYMPISMPLYYDESGYVKSQDDATSPSLAASAKASGYKQNDYRIYAASGDKDFMHSATEHVVETLRGYPEQFTYTDTNFEKGNLMYTEFPGKHRYYYSFPYIYNGLRRFFRD